MSKIIIAVYVLATTAALILLKLSSGSGSPVGIENGQIKLNLSFLFIVAVCLYMISFILYTYLISKFDLGYIIPLGTALVYILIFIASFIIFKEGFSLVKIAGILLTVIGIIMLQLGQTVK